MNDNNTNKEECIFDVNKMFALNKIGFFKEPKRIRPIAFQVALNKIFNLVCECNDVEWELQSYLRWNGM